MSKVAQVRSFFFAYEQKHTEQHSMLDNVI